MRIGIIGDAPVITHSVAVVCGQLAKQFVKMGHQVSYLGYGLKIPSPIQHSDGYLIYPDTIPLTTKDSVLNFINACGGVDILYLHGSKDVFRGAIEAGKEKNIPVVCHTFYSTPYANDKVSTFEAKNGFILYDCEHVDDMFVCNNFSVGVGFALGRRTWRNLNGVDKVLFKIDGVAKQKIRDKLSVPRDSFVFLFSGSNLSGKDPGRALDAFAKFYYRYKYEDTYLVMHTQPSNSHLNLPKIAEDLGVRNKVKFFTDYFPEWLIPPQADENYQKGSFSPPYIFTPYEDMPCVYQIGDVQIATTLMEGQSTTMLEGMACGLPIICSDDPVVSEVVVPYETGLLCRRLVTNECLAEDIVKNMKLLYNDRNLTKEMGKKASQYVHIRHNWESIAELFIYYFKNLIDNYYG